MYLMDIQIWKVTYASECILTNARDLRLFSSAVQRAMYAAANIVVEPIEFELHFCSFTFPVLLEQHMQKQSYTAHEFLCADTIIYLCIDCARHVLSIGFTQDDRPYERLQAIYAVSTTDPNVCLHTTCNEVDGHPRHEVVESYKISSSFSVKRALDKRKPISFIILSSF